MKFQLYLHRTQQPTRIKNREIYQIFCRIYGEYDEPKKWSTRSRNRIRNVPSSLKLVFATQSVNITTFYPVTPLQAVWQWQTIITRSSGVALHNSGWHFQQLTLEGRVQQSVSPTRPRGRRVISSWTHDGLTRTERLLVPVSLDRSLLLGPNKEDGITRVSSLSTPQPCVEQSLLRLLICYDRMITLKILWANLVSLLFFI